MSRFSDFGLYRRSDERFRPAEKDLSTRFFSEDNVRLLLTQAQSSLHPGVSYSQVTTAMDAVFRLAIGREGLSTVADMNVQVLEGLSREVDAKVDSENRYADRTFAHSNIPSRFLPRPSYDSNPDDQGDDGSVDLLRRR